MAKKVANFFRTLFVIRRAPLRIIQIIRIVLHYRLDGLLAETRMATYFRFLRPFTPNARQEIANQPAAARLRLALQELGPIFVKFGQILSTRRDLLPEDIAEQLSMLKDQVQPFDGDEAKAIITNELGGDLSKHFQHVEPTPLASASIAQVHAATMLDGSEVVVKVVRPGIAAKIESDLVLLEIMAELALRFGPDPERIRPDQIVAEIRRALSHELDLQREGANASLLGRNFEQSNDLRIPKVHWAQTTENVLTLERMHGVPADDVKAIEAAGMNRSMLAQKGIELFYTQVFRDNFFHADAHAGNIWVDTSQPNEARFIALDFGIMGSLPDADQYYIAENFSAVFNRDYRRVAELHIEAGWMPDTIRVDELEAAVRTVCEPYFTRPLSEISLGEVLAKLFKVAHQFHLTIQPQLLLLQKTLLNVEGIGRTLDPKLDIWETAKPVLADIMRQRNSPIAAVKRLAKQMPAYLHAAEEMPELVHQLIKTAHANKVELTMRSKDLEQLAALTHQGQRQMVYAILGSGLLIVGAVMFALEAGGPSIFNVSLAVWMAGLGAAWAFAAAWPRGDRRSKK